MWFKQVEAEANPEVSETLEIATVPTFILIKVLSPMDVLPAGIALDRGSGGELLAT